jgi:hypothetical protein
VTAFKVKRYAMKKIVFLSLALMFFLVSCGNSSGLIIEVKTDDGGYRNGFYGDLYVIEPETAEKAFKYGKQQFYYLNSSRFDLRITYENPAVPTAFCAVEQWQEAKEYYSKNENFDFYCLRGNVHDQENSEIFSISGVDYEKWDMLFDFAEGNGYDPFGAENENIKRIESDEHFGNCEIIFYKESKDGAFISFKGHNFHLLDGKLVLTYYYDHNFGEKREFVYVEVPREIAIYFENLLEKLN